MVVELKLCERCGAFWLRRQNSAEIYCATCLPAIRRMADPQRALDRKHAKAGSQ